MYCPNMQIKWGKIPNVFELRHQQTTTGRKQISIQGEGVGSTPREETNRAGWGGRRARAAPQEAAGAGEWHVYALGAKKHNKYLKHRI